MFDIAIGLNSESLVAISQSLYSKLYPNVFKGAQNTTFEGVVYTVGYDVQLPPTFNLQSQGNGANSSFQMIFPKVEITISGGITVVLDLSLTATCSVQANNNVLTIAVTQVAAPTQSNGVQNYLLQNIVVPQILTIAQSMAGGITVPPIFVENVGLSNISVGVANNCIIALASLSNTPPPPDNSFPWPDTQFFSLLSQNLIQQILRQVLLTMQYNTQGSGSCFDWEAFINPESINVNIEGPSIDVIMPCRGSMNTMGGIFGSDNTLEFIPDIEINLGLQIQGNTVTLKTQNVNEFVIQLESNNILQEILDEVLNIILYIVSPFIVQVLTDVTVGTLNIPSYSVNIAGQSVTATPFNMQITNTWNALGFVGQLNIN